MLKIVLDTNVLVSSTIIQGKQFELLKLAKIEKIKLISSPQIIEEFKEVISREKFGFSEEQISNAIRQILDIAEIVIPKNKLEIIKDDIDDNIILECAVEAKADFIISGDAHLLALKSYQDIKIINTSDFFDKYFLV
jgi:putative PIN family toxin of toxin-antitoxin system